MVNKNDFKFDRESNFYRQMYISHIGKSDTDIIDEMKTVIEDQLAVTKVFQILENPESGIKEVWSITPKSECKDV